MRTYTAILEELDSVTSAVQLSIDLDVDPSPLLYADMCRLDRELKCKLLQDDIYSWFYPD